MGLFPVDKNGEGGQWVFSPLIKMEKGTKENLSPS